LLLVSSTQPFLELRSLHDFHLISLLSDTSTSTNARHSSLSDFVSERFALPCRVTAFA
jgi:hypothetical protein